MYKQLYIFLIFSACALYSFAQKNPEAKKLQKMVVKAVERAMPAVIKITPYDTVSKTLSNSRFSGVVVNSDGLILSAAHATQPKQLYQVTFANGRKVLAQGLGRISLGNDKPATDVAMLQIIEKEKWPFAKMGYSSDMRNGQPCIGISFPGTFEQILPNVRLGRLENVEIGKGHFQSSCKMEPGDSGGPLFDYQGNLIGIHSWILPDEHQNFEVPIDLYHIYWDALHVPITYTQLPKPSRLEQRSVASIADSIPPLDSIAKIDTDHQSTVVKLQSVMSGRPLLSLGTVVEIKAKDKSVTAIVAQNSTTGDQPRIMLGEKQFEATVIARDVENNLALLMVKETLPQRFMLNLDDKKQVPSPGDLLFSVLPAGNVRTGIASTGLIKTLLKYSSGYFGASATFIKGSVTISDIAKGSPADGILQLNDQIKTINGVSMERPEQYGSELAKYYPYDVVTIDAFRGGQIITLRVKLSVFRPNFHSADSYPGGRSMRSDGFRQVIAQDAALKPTECGGPVFNADGSFIGINIGRHSRTSTMIIPVEIIKMFLKRTLLIQS